MKRLINLSFLSLFLLTSLNIGVKVHFCGDGFDHLVWFGSEQEEDACDCFDFGKTDCCSDFVIHAQGNPERVTPRLVSAPDVNSFKLFYSLSLVQTEPLFAKNVFRLNKHNKGDWPPTSQKELSLLQVFRI
jgi:hypothetical protein